MKQTLSTTIKGLVKENYKAENKRLKRERDAKEAELNLEKEVRNALGFSIKSMINKNTQHKEPKTPSDSSDEDERMPGGSRRNLNRDVAI